MAWEKSFDVEDTLGKVMEAFWKRGFEATSMQDLVDATGVNRASLYATYGSKRDLFAAALKKYDRDVRGRMMSQLTATETPLRAIAAVFDRFIGQVRNPGTPWGCFMINSALEQAPHDANIALLVNKAQDDIEAFLLAMIRLGQESGEISARLDPKETARQALATLMGLLVTIRSRPDEAYLTSIRDGFLNRLT